MIFMYFLGFQVRAGIAVDFCAQRDFNDLWGGPGHRVLQSE
jgi:hypothetical protein